jgi:hypothetical protein
MWCCAVFEADMSSKVAGCFTLYTVSDKFNLDGC